VHRSTFPACRLFFQYRNSSPSTEIILPVQKLARHTHKDPSILGRTWPTIRTKIPASLGAPGPPYAQRSQHPWAALARHTHKDPSILGRPWPAIHTKIPASLGAPGPPYAQRSQHPWAPLARHTPRDPACFGALKT
jgi:hypothetical protein